MKKHLRKICLLTLVSALIISSFAPFYTSAKENNLSLLSEDSTCQMHKDGDYYYYTGPVGDASTAPTEDTQLISSAEDYYALCNSDKAIAPVGNDTLPSSVDLSQNPAFPPVGDQKGLGSCATFSCVYYQFTYAMNSRRNIETTLENSFSPLFVFNFVSGGSDLGTTYVENYDFLKEFGAPPSSIVPYTDQGPLDWFAKDNIWREASYARLESYVEYDDVGTNADNMITSPDDPDLIPYKTALSEGKVLGFSTTVYDWKSIPLKANPDAPGNDNFVGEQSVTHCAGYQGAHRMAIVGYNDDIWTDINLNDKVDEGEMGAFKIVNSWGDGYCNKGFVWVAYDALNTTGSSVDGGYSGLRAPAISFVTSIEVRDYNEQNDIYMEFTLNTAERTQLEIILNAEKNGTISSKELFFGYGYKSELNKGAFDGTSEACDGTFQISLDNVIEDLQNENFEDYTWSVTFTDTTEDSNPLIIKDVKVYNDHTGKVYSADETTLPVTLDASSQEIFAKESTLPHKVIYYTGYDNPTLHYSTGDEIFTEVKMEANIERRKYVNKYLIENVPEDIKLYFTDDEGNLDDNNGDFYTATDRLNFYTTEGVKEELDIHGFEFLCDEVDVNKAVQMKFDTRGGYEPYHYQMTIENLASGESFFRSYKFMWYMDYPAWTFREAGEHKITISALDHTDKEVTREFIVNIEDLPFEFESFTKSEGTHFVGESIHFEAKSKNEGVFSHGPSKNIYHFEIKDEEGNVCYTHSQNSNHAHYGERFSLNQLDYIPHKKGNYTITISSTDWLKQTAEISLDFTVFDKVIGDANGDGKVNIRDATLIQQFVASLLDESGIYGELSDCDTDAKITVRDATNIQKYLASLNECGQTGSVIEYIPPTVPPTEPPTEEPTEAPTEEPTEPEVNRTVTFTNSLNWSGTISCYYWSTTDTAMTTWPGVPMTNAGINDFGQTLYTFEVPEGATYIIFTNGSAQTVDIDYPGGNLRYYALEQKNGNGHNVGMW